MTKEWYLKRINNIDVNSIRNLGSNSLARLTCNFNPLFVGKLILRGASVSQQRFILQYIDTKYIKWVNETKPKSEPALYYELIKDVNLSLDCGMIIKPEELDKFISDAENNTITDVKKSETTAALEARINELKEENRKLKEQGTQVIPPVHNEDTASLRQLIKELKEENERLCKEKDELKEIKMIMDTPLDGIEADSKVGLTVILKLMENDGANFVKHNNKTIAVKALKMMTGRSESACKQIFSSPLSPTYPQHKIKIAELNEYLKTLGMKTLI